MHLLHVLRLQLPLKVILTARKLKICKKNGVLGLAIRCAVKTKNSVTFEDLEKGKKYEVSCDGGVSDDISEGKNFILEVI